MKMTMKTLFAGLAFAAVAVTSQASFAAGDAKAPKDVDWSFEGAFGTYDRASAQRGLQIYKEVCAACHGLKYVAFRTLGDLGFSEAQVKALAAQVTVPGDLDEYGEPTTRPGAPSDKFPSPFANDIAARAAMNGALPPDLSLMIKARPHGADYVYSLLTGYDDSHEAAPGMNYNPYFAGSQIAMAQPLYDDQVEYADGTPATMEQMSKDVVTFLAWAAEPKLEDRHSAGYKVLAFLLVLTVLLYFSNRKVWASMKKKD